MCIVDMVRRARGDLMVSPVSCRSVGCPRIKVIEHLISLQYNTYKISQVG